MMLWGSFIRRGPQINADVGRCLGGFFDHGGTDGDGGMGLWDEKRAGVVGVKGYKIDFFWYRCIW
jgi:hypothetical protein